MSTRDTGTYQMLWDCQNCGTEKLLGIDHRHCPNCGTPQEPKRRYFPAEEDKVLAKDHIFAGADKVCAACDAPNGARAEFCGTCGCPLDDAEEAARRKTQKAASPSAFAEDSAHAAEDEHEAARRKANEQRQRMMANLPPEPEEAPKKGKGGLFAGLTGVLMLVFAIVCCGGLGFFFFWKQEASFTVAGHSWERTIEVETYKAAKKSDWKEDVPSKANDVRCSKEEKGSKKVADGETCSTKRKDNGDGTFTEQEECRTKYKEVPTYGEKCSYTVNDWVVTRTEDASGQGLSSTPAWPEVSIKGNGKARLGNEREGDREQTYTVLFSGPEGKSYDCDFSNEGTWKGYTQGATYDGEIGVMSKAIDCGSLKKQ